MRIAVTSYTATSALGHGLQSIRQAIGDNRSGLRKNDLAHCDLDTWIGRVDDVESVSLPARLAHLQSRNNQLTLLGLEQDGFLSTVKQSIERFGVDRIGVIMATSTSGIGRTEEGYRQLGDDGMLPSQYRQPWVHNLHSPGLVVAELTGLTGPSITISTACSSSAKIFASAARWIRHGLVDAVLVGGVDSLCLSVMYGFNSLELLSANPCRPFDIDRDGISLGEAACFALLARADRAPEAEFALLGYGESTDAYHMSHPHPDGKGAVLAMQQALKRAGIPAASVGYINLHGTASKANDLVETNALAQVFPSQVMASSTKGWTGHTLGTAGIMEAVITLESMKNAVLPGTLNCVNPDPGFNFAILTENVHQPVAIGMTNSFGFGGNNASLIFGRNDD